MTRNGIAGKIFPVFIVLAAGSAHGQSAGGSAPASVEITQVSGDVYLLAGGSGANSSALTGPDGILLVDSKTDAASAEAMANGIARDFGGTIRFLVNTHEHPDHTGGNEVIGGQGATIIAQQGVYDVLAAGQRGGPPAPEIALPRVTIGQGQSLRMNLNGATVEVIDMPPAHTAANAMVRYVEANVFHLGDLYTRTRYPVIAGGTLQGFIDSIDAVLAMSDSESKFIPGVGAVGDRADLRAYRDMLVTVGERVAVLAGQGKSLEEVSAASPTAEFDATYGDPGRLFLPVIYRQAVGE
jgi:glyoxylase-like metal-dependent hydrolase (beta-lactamase superfamily II)